MEINEFINNVLPMKDKMLRLARNILRHREDSEDLVQEAMIKLWKKKDDLKSCESLTALVMITTKNLCIDKLRAQKRKFVNIDEIEIAEQSNDRLTIEEQNDTFNKVKLIIESLPINQKIIVHMKDVEGMSNEEIAKIMNIEIVSVRVNLSRARKTIREQFVKHYNYIPYEN